MHSDKPDDAGAAPNPLPMDNPVGAGAAPNLLRIDKLDHVGVAVDDAEAAIKNYTERWGYTLTHRETRDDAGLELVWLQAGDLAVELVVPLRDGTTVANFLANRGPGLHHMAVRVEDIDTALTQLAAQGVRLLDKSPRPGGQGTRIAFVHPSDGSGVLWELVERPG